MAIIKDLIRIYDLINNIIILKHPITMDIRYWYHAESGRVKGYKTLTRKEWDKGGSVARLRGYTVMEFIKTMLLQKNNRKNLILTLSLAMDRAARNYQGSRPNVTKLWR